MFSVARRAICLVGIPATALSAACLAAKWPSDAGQPATARGVVISIYQSEQELSALPDLVEGELPNLVIFADRLDLDLEQNSFGALKERFLTEVTATLDIPHGLEGTWSFRLISDDGARLYVDDRLVVDHDGLHGPDPKDASIYLRAGAHQLRVRHFQNAGGARLLLLWKRPGAGEFEPIPAEALRPDSSGPFETAPGPKRMIPALRRGRPGDGSPLTGPHPGYEMTVASSGSVGIIARKPCTKFTILARHVGDSGAPAIILPRWEHWAEFIGRQPVVTRWGSQMLDLGDEFPAEACEEPVILAAGEHNELYRVVPEEVSGIWQGCAFRFSGGLPGPVSEVLDSFPDNPTVIIDVPRSEPYPDGHAFCTFKPTQRVAFEMQTVRILSNGLEIEFSKALDPRVGWDPDCYYIEQWPFDVERGKPPARDGVVYPVRSASVLPGRRKVFLEVEGLKTSHVVYLRLLPPMLSEDGELPWSTEAWYTLNAIPRGRFGQVLNPPPKEPQNFLTAEEKAAGWKLLFDGETTAGWHGWKKRSFPGGWKIIDGCLVRVGPAGDIATDEEFDDFELSLEWRISPGGNSGIFFRVDESLDYPWQSGPEMQVLDNAEHPDGRNPKTSAGSNYGLHAPVRDATSPVGFFNRVRIVARGSHVEYWLNDVKVVEYELGSPEWQRLVADSKFKSMPNYGRVRRGRIVLQDHGDRVWYRNIKIRPLRSE